MERAPPRHSIFKWVSYSEVPTLEDWVVSEQVDLVTLAVFAATIFAVVALPIDKAGAAIAGAIVMVLLTGYTFTEAFASIEWNVLFILLGMWIIAEYVIKSGIPEYVMSAVSRRSKSYRGMLLSMSLVAGFISIFVDNVLVILLVGRLVVEAAKRAGRDPLKASLLIGLAANYMGTALLMGDLPPQLLHVVAGAEFLDFIVFRGLPSSFPLLTVSFTVTLLLTFKLFDSGGGASPVAGARARLDKPLAAVSLAFFALTVVLMAFRRELGVPLGAITMTTASLLVLTVEAMKRLGGRYSRMPGFGDVLGSIEWRALLFYGALFVLVGGLEDAGIIHEIATRLEEFIAAGLYGYSILYWVVGALSAVIEHDALLYAMLLSVRDAAELAGVDPWPFYWGMAWSSTLGSNATIAGAPALYIAVTLAEREKRVRPMEILRLTIPFAVVGLAVHYILSAIVFYAPSLA
jgi:Na+/H+ antiporter NhaD/arsenite permease-like protein